MGMNHELEGLRAVMGLDDDFGDEEIDELDDMDVLAGEDDLEDDLDDDEDELGADDDDLDEDEDDDEDDEDDELGAELDELEDDLDDFGGDDGDDEDDDGEDEGEGDEMGAVSLLLPFTEVGQKARYIRQQRIFRNRYKRLLRRQDKGKDASVEKTKKRIARTFKRMQRLWGKLKDKTKVGLKSPEETREEVEALYMESDPGAPMAPPMVQSAAPVPPLPPYVEAEIQQQAQATNFARRYATPSPRESSAPTQSGAIRRARLQAGAYTPGMALPTAATVSPAPMRPAQAVPARGYAPPAQAYRLPPGARELPVERRLAARRADQRPVLAPAIQPAIQPVTPGERARGVLPPQRPAWRGPAQAASRAPMPGPMPGVAARRGPPPVMPAAVRVGPAPIPLPSAMPAPALPGRPALPFQRRSDRPALPGRQALPARPAAPGLPRARMGFAYGEDQVSVPMPGVGNVQVNLPPGYSITPDYTTIVGSMIKEHPLKSAAMALAVFGAGVVLANPVKSTVYGGLSRNRR